MQTCKNGKNSNSRLSYMLPKIFSWVLPILVLPLLVSSYHPIQLKGKLMNQTLENYEKLILDPILTRLGIQMFAWGLLLLVVRHCSMLWPYAISRKTKKLNFRKWQKKLILGPILACLAQIWTTNFFLSISTLLVASHCSKLSSYLV